MTAPQIAQILSILLFIYGASVYYNIRRTLNKQGYPVSVFVYSGPCWEHYNDLIRKSEPAEARRLKIRKASMTIALVLAFLVIFISSLMAKQV
jgi:uncharacterized membrane protein YiaA